jgi:hypothetical protein
VHVGAVQVDAGALHALDHLVVRVAVLVACTRRVDATAGSTAARKPAVVDVLEP